MSVGSRRTRIDIIGVTSIPDDIGGQVPTETIVKSTWAQSKELTGNRAAEFAALYNKQPISLIIRTLSYPVTTNNLIDYRGKRCTIHSISTDPLKKLTEILVWV